MENKTSDCKFCGNSGVIYVPNGPDDFDASFCFCAEGKKLEENSYWALSGWKKIKVEEQPSDFVV